MSENKKTPKIRFEGFIDTWEQRKVQCLIDDGIIEEPMDGNHGEKHPTVSDYAGSGIPFLMARDISNGKVDIKYCNFISERRAKQLDKGFAKNGDVLLTHKATIGEVAILDGLSSEYAVLTPQVTYYRIIKKSKLDTKYLYAYFNSPRFQKDIKTEAIQSTRSYIGITDQHKLNMSMPIAIEEQKKIGNYFMLLDDLITLHQRKYEKLVVMKKSMMEKMFPKNEFNVPEIRFAGFVNDWEQRKLKEISEKVVEKNANLQHTETFTNSAEYGIISQRDFFDHDISNSDNIGGYYVVRNEDFVYNPRVSTYAPVGPINRNKLGRNGVMSPLYTVFRTHDMDNCFLEQYFKSNHWHSFMRLNGDSGARSDRFSIKDSVLVEMPIPYPSLDEQLAIGKYLTTIDNLITLHQHKLEKLKQIKKSMLEIMFV